jgi:hypothetical protein
MDPLKASIVETVPMKALELKAMPVVERWREQDRRYLFIARRD